MKNALFVIIAILLLLGIGLLFTQGDYRAIEKWSTQRHMHCSRIEMRLVRVGPFVWLRSKAPVYRASMDDGRIFWFHRRFVNLVVKEEINGDYRDAD